jgi:hypothetical protein
MPVISMLKLAMAIRPIGSVRSTRLEFASAFGGGPDMDGWLAPIVSGAIDPLRS